MITVEKLKGEHLMKILEDPVGQSLKHLMTPAALQVAEQSPYSFTVLENGVPIACLGLQEYWPGRAECWALMANRTGKHMIVIHRAVKKFLETCPVTRIEAAVESDFEAGHRWAELLGFQLEALCLKKYFINGKDACLYARVRE